MTSNLTRRLVLGLGSGFAASAVLSDAPAAEEAEAVFLAQSGPLPGLYCLGAIATSDLAAERAEIAKLRADLKYARVLRAKSTDKRKAEFGLRLIDRLLNGASLSFCGIMAGVGAAAKSEDVRRQVLRAASTAPVPVYMTAQGPRAASKRSRQIAQTIITGVTIARTVELRHPKDDDLLQLAGFLAALVRLDQTGASGPANDAVLAYLKGKLKVAKLDAASLEHHPKFRVIPFTA